MGVRAAAACLLLLLVAPAASYADEGELQLSVAPTYSMFGRDRQPDAHGGGASVDVWLGLAPAAWLFIGGGVQHASDITVYEAAFGVAAALDVLRVVPYVEAAIALDLAGDQTYPVLRAGLGADYLITPELALGVVGRQRFFFGEQGERLLTLGLRLTWRLEID